MLTEGKSTNTKLIEEDWFMPRSPLRLSLVLSLAPLLTLPAFARADNSPGAAKNSPEPTIEQATKGLKGKGPLQARLDVETKDLKGTFTCALFDDKSPKTVANFVALARGLRPWKDKSGKWVKKPLYDGVLFHRVIPNFMIQGGDPDGTGRGGPGYEFGDEVGNGLSFDKPGLLAMANKGPGTNGSQFFITGKEVPHLTGRHTIFGQCDPLDLEQKLAAVPTAGPNRPVSDVVIKKVTISRAAAPSVRK